MCFFTILKCSMDGLGACPFVLRTTLFNQFTKSMNIIIVGDNSREEGILLLVYDGIYTSCPSKIYLS